MCLSVKAGSGVLFRVAVCVLCASALRTSGPAAEAPESGTKFSDSKLPPYTFGYTNPLYGTIAGYLSMKDIELKTQQTVKLKIDTFRKEMPVKAIIQPGTAPLVVMLLGLDGRADGPLGRLWPSWFAEAGYHVLTFDSTFQPSFIKISGHGVTGNLIAESERVTQIIQAFLARSEIEGKVSKIGIVGMSYGGVEALLLGETAAAGKLPFKVEAVQAYSPPINLQKTGEFLDKWYNEDRWNFTLIQLADKLAGHKPVAPDQPCPFEDSLMRAGIAALFRLVLVDVVVRNDELYKLHLLPSGNQFDEEYIKQDYGALWGYIKFMNDMAFPYWRDKAGMKSLEDLTGPIGLLQLLPKQPPYSEVILAEDDPFNTPEDIAALKAVASKYRVVLLPHGGHLGFVNDPWTKAKLLDLFNTPAATPSMLNARVVENKETKK